MRRLPLLTAALAVTALAAAPVVIEPAGTTAPAVASDHDFQPDPDRWADAEDATIYPSVYAVTGGAGCTTNFVFEEFVPILDEDGEVIDHRRDVYIGYAAHCAGTGGQTDTNGCRAGSQDLGTPVNLDGADHPGTLAYSAWHTMIEVGQPENSAACGYNDFALVKIDPRDHDKVNPSVPFFGGPTGLGGATSQGDLAFTVGNSGLRQGIQELGPKYEISLGTQNSGWTHRMYAMSPGIPGDSGSGHMDESGAAFGVTSTLQAAPFAGSNGIADLAMSLAYMYEHTDIAAEVALGTEPFDSRLP